MQGILADVEGVENVQVDFATKTATVKVREGTDENTVVSALKGRYSGKLKE